MIVIREVDSKSKLKDFVKFPFELYKGSKYWVPPIISEEKATFNQKKNPLLKQTDTKLFLAYKNEKVVGRIAAIINWIEINEMNIKKLRFGWFDFADDYNVSKALLEKVQEIAIKYKLNHIEGPMGFSNLDKVGVLTHGFDHIGTMVTSYNFEYYKKHFEFLKFKVEKEYLEHSHDFKDIKIEKYNRLEKIIRERYHLKVINFKKTRKLMRYSDEMFDLFNQSYSKLSSFVKVTDIQKNYLKKKFLNFINPEYVKFVMNKKNELVAFAVVMPSFAETLQKINGKLFPTGIFHLLNNKNSKTVNFLLIGIHPDFQNKGVHAIIFNEFHRTFIKNEINICRRTPELANNIAIQNIWKDFNPKLIKKRCTYIKYL